MLHKQTDGSHQEMSGSVSNNGATSCSKIQTTLVGLTKCKKNPL
jgi:hypothetical protein